MNKIVISGTGLYTPPYSISNDELVKSFNEYVDHYNKAHPDLVEPLPYSNSEFIVKASGIKSRYVIEKSGILDIDIMRPKIPPRSPEEPSLQCEMSIQAAKEAFNNANITPNAVDLVIVSCSNMERAYPAIAIEIQHHLGIQGRAFDLNVACSSATFAIEVGYNALLAGNAKGVLILNPEICSAHLNFRDRDSHFIFGDACTAIILQRAEDAKCAQPFSIVSTRLQTEFSNNIRNNFGFLNSCESVKRKPGDLLFKQQGRKVFKEVVPIVNDLLINHIHSAEISIGDIKRIWLHQANSTMNHLIAKKLLGCESSETKVPTILQEYANTSSAGSIIAFHKYHSDFTKDDVGILCSFGAGYSIGSVLLRAE